MSDPRGWIPTARIRYVSREGAPVLVDPKRKIYSEGPTVFALQQWWAPNVPAYMIDPTQGEWRDVAVEQENGKP